jgi:hypothetical protein
MGARKAIMRQYAICGLTELQLMGGRKRHVYASLASYSSYWAFAAAGSML